MEDEIDAQRAKEEEIRHQSPEFILLEDEFAVKVHVQRRDELRRDGERLDENDVKTRQCLAFIHSRGHRRRRMNQSLKDCIHRN